MGAGRCSSCEWASEGEAKRGGISAESAETEGHRYRAQDVLASVEVGAFASNKVAPQVFQPVLEEFYLQGQAFFIVSV